TPFSASLAFGRSRRWSETGWSFPKKSPFAIRNNKLYAICPAAPVTATFFTFVIDFQIYPLVLLCTILENSFLQQCENCQATQKYLPDLKERSDQMTESEFVG